jgi:FkbM family methyltransferase
MTGLLRSVLIYYGRPFHTRKLARFYSQFVQSGDLCFDIGAHVGNRLAAWHILQARIVALEPQPHCMELLRRWYGRHPNITLVEKAVGAQTGSATLLISERNPTVSTLSRDWIERVRQVDSFANVNWNSRMQVSVTTLDALVSQYGEPAFCKIDVEGYELEVLRGLSRPLSALSFEFVPAVLETTRACIERVSQLGAYKFNWSLGEQHRWQSPQWLEPGEMLNQLERFASQDNSGDIYARNSSP